MAKRKKPQKPVPQKPVQPQPKKPSRFQRFARAIGAGFRRAAMQSVRGKPISRRRFLAGALGLGTMAALETAALKRAREIAAAKHEITFSFAAHAGLHDVAHFEDVLRSARILGHPYHAMGYEDASIRAGEHEKQLLEFKKINGELRDIYNQLLKQGIAKKQAFATIADILLKTVKTQDQRFKAGLSLLTLKYNLREVPIEWYDREELDRINTWQEMHKSILQNILELPTLEAQLTQTEHLERRRAENLIVRNRRIKEKTGEVIRLLRKHFPELAGEQRIRVLYTIGSAHIGLAELPTEKGIEFQYSISVPNVFAPVSIPRKLSTNQNAPLPKIDVARLVVAYNLQPHFTAFIERANIKEIQLVREKIAQLSLQEFEELNSLTANKPPKEKSKIIYNYLKNKK